MQMGGASRGGSVKRQREQCAEGEDVPATTTHTTQPLTLMAAFKSHFGMLVWAQLCNPQGVSMFSFVCLSSRVSRPFAGNPVYGMPLTHAQRLHALGCGFKGKLVRLLSLIVGHHFEPQRNLRACHKLMQSIARRVASGMAAAVRDKVSKEAEKLCASGQFMAAVFPLQRAIDWGDLPSRALKAWLHMNGRKGVALDEQRAFKMSEEGARVGCHHCQGVMACCYLFGVGCVRNAARSLELAHESSRRGSKYGQYTLGKLHEFGYGVYTDYAQAVSFLQLAAAQGLDWAQCALGRLYSSGKGVARSSAEARRWYQLAAAQGLP